jgi:hypothetical protein
MKYLIEQNLFDSVLKFVIAQNQNTDASRCNVVDITVDEEEYQLTICFNERKNQIFICEVINNLGNGITNELIITSYFKELINIVTNTTMNDKNLKLYKFYKEKIEPVTECCELNQ